MIEVPRDRPWQIMLSGPEPKVIDAETRPPPTRARHHFGMDLSGNVSRTPAGEMFRTPSDVNWFNRVYCG